MYAAPLSIRRAMATPELTKQDLQTVCNGLGENIETLQRWLAQTQVEAEPCPGGCLLVCRNAACYTL
jgi:hypothetical protein